MAQALAQAKLAESRGEVPVGAVIVYENQVIASAGNLRETEQNPLGHAECLAIQQASRHLKQWRLLGCTLYVTLEPCVMCAGAIVLSRLDRVVFGALDPKAGAVESKFQILSPGTLNHSPHVQSGILGRECSAVLSDFFQRRRSEK